MGSFVTLTRLGAALFHGQFLRNPALPLLLCLVDKVRVPDPTCHVGAISKGFVACTGQYQMSDVCTTHAACMLPESLQFQAACYAF